MKSMFKILFLSLCWTCVFLAIGLFGGWITISAPEPWLFNPWAFVYRHLRLSIVPFGILFLLYFYLIAKMQRCMAKLHPDPARLIYYDRLLNTIISTFFGVGVIWTAIGMETALMHALEHFNNGQEAVASLGAWGLLQRLVNGGLLLALSTTVFGGVCGYLLRLLKIVLLGKKWDQCFMGEPGRHEATES